MNKKYQKSPISVVSHMLPTHYNSFNIYYITYDCHNLRHSNGMPCNVPHFLFLGNSMKTCPKHYLWSNFIYESFKRHLIWKFRKKLRQNHCHSQLPKRYEKNLTRAGQVSAIHFPFPKLRKCQKNSNLTDMYSTKGLYIFQCSFPTVDDFRKLKTSKKKILKTSKQTSTSKEKHQHVWILHAVSTFWKYGDSKLHMQSNKV